MREVFISHSARGDDFAMAVRDSLVEKLRLKHYDVLVDQENIPPGDEWRPRIVDWLARCDAVVFLLNEKALTSSWVRREVNILLWRRALGAPLPVVPVLLGDLSTTEVKKTGLEELGPIQFARTPDGAPDVAEDIAQSVLDRFAELPAAAVSGDTPMRTWLDRLESYLSEARRAGELTRAATTLGLEQKYLPEVTAAAGGCLFLAHQFLVAPPARVERALNDLAPALPDGTLRRLIAQLSATWVDEEAARALLPGAGRTPRDMTVLLNARRAGTAQQYIRRATCCATLGYEVRSTGDLPTGEDRVGERFRDWEQTVWAQFFEADTHEDRILPDDLGDRTHYLVIDKSAPPDAEFAEAVGLLHDAFSWLIVLVTTGTPVPEPPVLAAFKNPVVPKPLLSASDEVTARLRNKRLAQLPDKLAGRYEESP
ncbi:toll/interleukin-1 receptor domain-containing protein [Streptomyces sp. NBC_00075]|uniref:Toll/interleukin-1 receptor domain-containing protein n=1 Tax=Streptomyces sp. NBC_00093 TaxID=2975649 RepID=A0AAU1ZVT5_9ACTN